MRLVVNDGNNVSTSVSWNSPVIMLTSNRTSVLDRFIQAILKGRKDCFLAEKETEKLQSLADYPVDYIDDEFAKTSLSIEEYLSFFGLANRIFSDAFAEDITAFLSSNHLQCYKDEAVCNLSTVNQLKTRLFISKKRNARLLILSNNNGGIKDEELMEISRYIHLFCQQHNMVAIITTRSTSIIEAYTGEMITF